MSKRNKEDCVGSFIFNQCNILTAPLTLPEFHNALKLRELDRGKARSGGSEGRRSARLQGAARWMIAVGSAGARRPFLSIREGAVP
jgi:hypothetical protein